MRFLLLCLTMACGSSALAENELLAKEARKSFQQHAVDFYRTSEKIENDLRLSISDERVLLHIRKRGFPYLAALIEDFDLYTYGSLMPLFPLYSFPGYTREGVSREEEMAAELFGRAVIVRLAAHQNACFHLLKELAPTPKAMICEQQAKELRTKIDVSSEEGYFQSLKSIRTLFDQLKSLPKLTEEQYVKERAESAVLAPREYGSHASETVPNARTKWSDMEVKWQRSFDHAGYVLAYSELASPHDFGEFKMVINQEGGIFEWNKEYSGSHEHPDSYESKLPEAELHALEDFIKTLPPSDAKAKEPHFVVSFLKRGVWTTRIYNALPEACPFDKLIYRMVRQSTHWWRPGYFEPDGGFLNDYPASK